MTTNREAFTAGTRVRRTDDGRTGTVAPDAITPEARSEHPDMVPVQYDHDDAWLTSPSVLVEQTDEARAAVIVHRTYQDVPESARVGHRAES